MISEPSGRRPDPALRSRSRPRAQCTSTRGLHSKAARPRWRASSRPNLRHGPGFAILQLAARHPGEPLPRAWPSSATWARSFWPARARLPRRQHPSATRRVGSAGLAGTADVRRRIPAPRELEALWSDLDAALRSELRDTSLDQWFKDRHAAWNVVGRVCFHLAENKADEERPFAFLATYSTRLSSRPSRSTGRSARPCATSPPTRAPSSPSCCPYSALRRRARWPRSWSTTEVVPHPGLDTRRSAPLPCARCPPSRQRASSSASLTGGRSALAWASK